MPSPQLSRRGALVAALALPAAAAAPTEVLAQSGSDADSLEVVHHWIEEVLRPLSIGQLAHPEQLAQPDLVMELHGAGANDDGTPRVLNGLPEVLAWLQQVKARHAAPVSVRIDKTLVQGDTVALLGENVWTLRGEGDSQQKRAQTIAAFYTLKDGKIAHIMRFTDRVGRKAS
jgi:ketosteroid isomerase-like protein